MAKKPKQTDEKPTVRAVIRRAQELREQASRARAVDPNLDLYAPTDDAARKLCSLMCQRHGKEDGPAMAILELSTRARLRELAIEEDGARASAARARHLKHRLVAAGETLAERSQMSLGQRLDRALLDLGLASEVPAAQVDGDRVSGGSKGAGLPRTDDRHGDEIGKALRLVLELEREADLAHRRRLEVAA